VIQQLQIARWIREGLEYGGLRLRATTSIDSARIAVTVDIGCSPFITHHHNLPR